MSCPWVMNTSGAMTATSAASGATFSASRSQPGIGQGSRLSMKKLRDTMVITVRPAIATQIQTSVMAASRAAGTPRIQPPAQGARHRDGADDVELQRQRIGRDRDRARHGPHGPQRALVQQRIGQPQQRQHAGKTQAPGRWHPVGQQDADQGRQLPRRPVHRDGAPVVVLLAGRGHRLGPALGEKDKVQVAGQVADGQPAPQRQMAEIEPPGGAEDDEAQVDAEGRGEQHPQRCIGGDQRQAGELGAAGEYEQRHADGLGDRQVALDHGHPGNQTPGGNAQRRRRHLARAAAELGVGGEGAQSI
mmetsp:Transcript_3220/g.5764  ORF Transcript_3220/g.5764 Transcript_3220/m.5764 type:complete len:304 (+) Transcript_3220:876-1787(+)